MLPTCWSRTISPRCATWPTTSWSMYLGKIVEQRTDARAVRRCPPSLHEGTAVGGAAAAGRRGRGRDRADGRNPVAARSAVWLPVPHALSFRHAALYATRNRCCAKSRRVTWWRAIWRVDMTEPHGPLQGVKVVACSTAQAGTVPYMLMADLGAEVIKIEVPEGGDNSRGSTVLPGMPSTYFETNNRGVKSVTLNLKAPEGRDDPAQAGRAAPTSSARTSGRVRRRRTASAMRSCARSIRGWCTSRSPATAPKGPNAALPGTDSMAQALGGIAEAYSMPGQKLRTGIVSVADETCAILAFGGALAALTHARTTGRRPEGRLFAVGRPDPADGLDAAPPRCGATRTR